MCAKIQLKQIDGLEGLDDFLESASLSIHIVAGDGTVLWANQAELDTLGYQPSEYVGHHIADFHADKDTINDILQRLSDKETLRNYHARLKTKDGSIKHVLINSNVYFKDDQFVHTRCFTRDVTDIVEAQHSLQKYTKDLEEANGELSDFAYVASHDLREPLRGISNIAGFIMEDHGETLDPEVSEYIDKLAHLAYRLDICIDSLLKISHVNSGDNDFSETVDLNVLLQELISALESSYNTVNFKVNIQSSLPTLCTNRFFLWEIFLNFFTNAIKYSENDPRIINVCYELKDDIPTFSVSDNGIGIKENHQDIIFNPFKRLHARNKFGGGTGVGLTIVKKMIEKLNGSVSVNSTPGKGSQFTFTIDPSCLTPQTISAS